jgi:TolB-like protein
MRSSSKANAEMFALGIFLGALGPWGAIAAEPAESPAAAAARSAPVQLRPEAARVAVLPVQNLSGEPAPLGAFQQWLIDELELQLIPLLDDMELRAFMRRNRMRYMGGLSKELGGAIREETGTSAVLVSSIDLYGEDIPPKFAMTSRLVSTGDDPRILWMESADRIGDEEPGFLGMGLIDNRAAVQRIVIDRLIESLVQFLRSPGPAERRVEAEGHARRRHAPKSFYRAAGIVPPRFGGVRIAVLPFANDSTAKRASEILTLHLIRHLVQSGAAEVVEPGVVRQALLRQRVIQEDGLSVPQSDLVRLLLNVDVALFGEVTEYRETGSATLEPRVEFSVRAIDTAARQVVWSSASYGEGDDGVFFFDAGRVPTAHRLSASMAGALVSAILPSLEVSP